MGQIPFNFVHHLIGVNKEMAQTAKFYIPHNAHKDAGPRTWTLTPKLNRNIVPIACQIHWLTSRRGIYLFRYFLSLMRTPILLLFAHNAYYAFSLQIAIRPECVHLGVRIQVHVNRHAYYAWANNKRVSQKGLLSGINGLNILRRKWVTTKVHKSTGPHPALGHDNILPFLLHTTLPSWQINLICFPQEGC